MPILTSGQWKNIRILISNDVYWKSCQVYNNNYLKSMAYNRTSKFQKQPKPKYKDGQNGAVEKSDRKIRRQEYLSAAATN